MVERASHVQRNDRGASVLVTDGHAGLPIGELAALWRLGCDSEMASHPYVVPLIEAMADKRHMYFVFPHADAGDLFDAVSATEGGFPELEARRYFRQIVHGLLHLKRHGLSHG